MQNQTHRTSFSLEYARFLGGTGSPPPVLGWGMYGENKALTHCAILSLNNGGNVVTACRGGWGISEPWAWFQGRDTVVYPKCGACVAYVNVEREREGLEAISGIHPRYEIGGEA